MSKSASLNGNPSRVCLQAAIQRNGVAHSISEFSEENFLCEVAQYMFRIHRTYPNFACECLIRDSKSLCGRQDKKGHKSAQQQAHKRPKWQGWMGGQNWE